MLLQSSSSSSSYSSSSEKYNLFSTLKKSNSIIAKPETSEKALLDQIKRIRLLPDHLPLCSKAARIQFNKIIKNNVSYYEDLSNINMEDGIDDNNNNLPLDGEDNSNNNNNNNNELTAAAAAPIINYDTSTSVDLMDSMYGTCFGNWVKNEKNVATIAHFLANTVLELTPSITDTLKVMIYVCTGWSSHSISRLVRSIFPAAKASTISFIIERLPAPLHELLCELLPAILCPISQNAVLDALTGHWDFSSTAKLIYAIDAYRPATLTHEWRIQCLRRWATSSSTIKSLLITTKTSKNPLEAKTKKSSTPLPQSSTLNNNNNIISTAVGILQEEKTNSNNDDDNNNNNNIFNNTQGRYIRNRRLTIISGGEGNFYSPPLNNNNNNNSSNSSSPSTIYRRTLRTSFNVPNNSSY